MTALGFHRQLRQDSKTYRLTGRLTGKKSSGPASNLLDAIVADGKVTLDEFMALMTGEVLGHNQYEEVLTVFAVLCKSDGEGRHDNLITLDKLEAACRQFEVGLLRLRNIHTHALMPSRQHTHAYTHTWTVLRAYVRVNVRARINHFYHKVDINTVCLVIKLEPVYRLCSSLYCCSAYSLPYITRQCDIDGSFDFCRCCCPLKI